MKNNLAYKALAIFLAILLWLYVTNQQNPFSEATYYIPLEINNLPPKLVLSENLSYATVRIMARRQILEKITSKDIHAYLKLNNPHVGINKASITVTIPKGTELVSVSPTQANVALTTITSKQLPIKVKILNPPPTGYLMLTEQLTPTQALVSGPLNMLEKVAEIVIDVDLSEQRTNYLQRLPIRIYDEKGNDLSDYLKVKPEIAEVYIALSPSKPSKQVIVKPTFSGKLPIYKIMKNVIIDPQRVVITGPEDLLNTLQEVETAPIELSGKRRTFTEENLLQLPDGITAYPSQKIRVTVEIVNR